MRLIHLILYVVVVFVIISGFRCGDCLTVDCDDGGLAIQFQSKTDSSNLFSNGTYAADSLGVLALRNDATTFDYADWSGLIPNTGDPYLYMVLTKEATGYVFRYNSQEQDTLATFYSFSDTKCCGETTSFFYGIFREDTVYAQRNGFLYLKK